MRLLLLSSLVVMVLAVRARDAEACCMPPPLQLSPPAGAHLPPRGSLYVFFKTQPVLPNGSRSYPDVLAGSVTISGATFERHVVHQDTYSYVLRLDYQATADRISVSWGGPDLSPIAKNPSDYPITKTPAPDHAQVLAMHHEETVGRSYTNALRLEVHSTAVAYRLEWGDGSLTYLPADPSVYMEPLEGYPKRKIQNLDLGHLECFGWNVDPKRLATLRAFQLFALFPDGSEQAFPFASARLADDGVQLPFQLLEEPFRSLAAFSSAFSTPSRISQKAPASRSLFYAGLLIGSTGALGLTLLVLGVRRFRRSRALIEV